MKVQTDVKAGLGLIFIDIDLDVDIVLGGGCKRSPKKGC